MSAPSPKLIMRCSTCGSDQILRDAWATWDFSQQQWVLDQIFDHAYCEICEGDASVETTIASSADSPTAVSISED